MAKGRIAGVAYVYGGGLNFSLKSDLEIDDQELVRAMLAGQDGVPGPQEMPKVPSVTMTVSTDRDIDMDVLRNLVGVTITCELANGASYVLRNAVYVDESTVNTTEGEVGLKFSGESGDWI